MQMWQKKKLTFILRFINENAKVHQVKRNSPCVGGKMRIDQHFVLHETKFFVTS
jgi:hypothetical protein